ncbi:DEAD/DEAH box helicase [bacterium]|nr:DEAD/DEAH box helicase [bacterium]
MTSETSNEAQLHPVLAKMGFSQSTQIQNEAIPVLARGESVLALSPTGSGKTLAFLVPLMERLDPELSVTQLLILAPTRELGAQIAQVASQVAAVLAEENEKNLQVRTVFGGQKTETQRTEIFKNPAVVVATPGRALELIEQEVLKTSGLKSLVLDEADLMVGMGFEAQIKMICDHLPGKIQAALFSATESEGQSRLQNRLVHRGTRIDVRSVLQADENTTLTGSPRIIHQVVLMPKSVDRQAALGQLLRQISDETETGIIFCQTRNSVQAVVDSLKEQGIPAVGLSGELGQIERATMMRMFKAGGVKYLVATNLAARGIDVSDLSVVVHFEIPSTQQEYLHRSGRSGRAGKSGRTISLCTPQSRGFLHDLLKGTDVELVDLPMAAEPLSEPRIETRIVPEFLKIHINRGKSSKLRPGDILGALTQSVGLQKEDVGGIFIFDHFTHVEVARQHAGGVLKKLSAIKIKNLMVKATTAGELSAPRGRGF